MPTQKKIGFGTSQKGFLSLNAVTTGTGDPFSFHDCRQADWFIEYSGAPSAGTIIIEGALASDYAETWYQIAVINATDLVTGLDGYGTYPDPPLWIRARIGDPIVDGEVSVYLNGLLG